MSAQASRQQQQRQRADAATRKARAEARIRAARRKRRIITVSVVVGVLLVIAGIGIGIQSTRGAIHVGATPTGATSDAGIGVGQASAPVRADFYEDFQCPGCGKFERSAGEAVAELINSNKLYAVFHPMAFLGPESTRASNASACAADEGGFLKYHAALYRNQPPEKTNGYRNTDLIAIAGDLGLSNKTFRYCVEKSSHVGWVQKVTDQASQKGVVQTPTIFLDGKQMNPADYETASAFRAAVEKVASAK
jgi:protein-disulfide isomerase